MESDFLFRSVRFTSGMNTYVRYVTIVEFNRQCQNNDIQYVLSYCKPIVVSVTKPSIEQLSWQSNFSLQLLHSNYEKYAVINS